MLEMPMNEGHHDSPEVRSASHPLEVVSTSVEVGAVELSPWKCALNPLEGLFMANVHSEGDLGLESIAAKVTLSDQEAHQKSLVEVTWFGRVFHGKHDGETVQREGGPNQVRRVADAS